MSEVGFAGLLARERAVIDEALDRILPPADVWPDRLHAAMRHAVFGGGKRIRPILTRLACQAAGGDPDTVIEAAAALELIHTYSLVHDDLPALDNDSLRRGRPTVHVAFDEPLAILAGDALLTEGFAVLARYPAGDTFAGRRAAACGLVAIAVGSRGMVGGQVEDIEATGSTAAGRDSRRQTAAGPSSDLAARLERIHRAKTGALLAASVELGALLAGAAGRRLGEFAAFGRDLGLAFQIADDILDVTGSAADLGKSPGKDAAAGKLTYPAVYGMTAASAELARLRDDLVARAVRLEGADGTLAALAEYIARRDR